MALCINWQVKANAPNITKIIPNDSTHTYDLFNLKILEAIRYGERTWGVNLVWTDPASSDNLRFRRESGSQDPLKFEEPIAINVRNGKWLKYYVRDRGVNIGWSDTPIYEWKIQGGNAGAEIPVNEAVALYNSVENDTLMYEPRLWGINLKWYEDSAQIHIDHPGQ